MHHSHYNYQSPPQKKSHPYNKSYSPSTNTNPYQIDQQYLTQTQQSQSNKKIVINLQTKSNKKLQLSLSVQNYKNEFKQFIRKNQIEKKQAGQIKKQIVMKLKEIAYKSQQMNKYDKNSNNMMNNKYYQDYYQQEQQQKSPRFSPIHQNTDEQSIISTVKNSNYKTQNKNKISYQNNDDQIYLNNYQQVQSAYFVDSIKKYQSNQSQRIKQSPKVDKQIQTIQTGIRQVKYLHKYQNQINQFSFQNEVDSFTNKKYNLKIQEPQKHKQIIHKQLFNTPSPKKCILLENYTSKTNISKDLNKQKKQMKQKKINRTSKYNKRSQSKSKQKQSISKPKKNNNNYLDQRQLNHNVFFKLHSTLTASFLQKSKQEINRKQLQNYKQILAYQQYKSKSKSKQKSASSSSSKQLFNRLYLTSTQSSFYRNKKQSSQFQCQSPKHNQSEFQIQNIIKLNQINQIKKKPNLSSRVYESNRIKNCNQHCGEYEYEKKKKKEKQIVKEKLNSIKKQIKQRSIEKLNQDVYNNRNINKSAKKRSGECPCCHKDKIQQKIKQRQQKSPKRWQKWKQYSSKSPNVKVNFISDVLEQSYIQLFPSQNVK